MGLVLGDLMSVSDYMERPDEFSSSDYMERLRLEFWRKKHLPKWGRLSYEEAPLGLYTLAPGSWKITLEDFDGKLVDIYEKDWSGLAAIIEKHRGELQAGYGIKFTFVPGSQLSVKLREDGTCKRKVSSVAYISVVNDQMKLAASCLGTGMFLVEVEFAMLEDIRYRQYMSAGTEYERMSLYERKLRASLKVFDECGFGKALRGILTGQEDQSPPVEIQYGGIRFSKKDDLERVTAQIKWLEDQLRELFSVPTSEIGYEDAIAVLRATEGMSKDLEIMKKRKAALWIETNSKMLDEMRHEIEHIDDLPSDPKEAQQIWAEAMGFSEQLSYDRWPHWKWSSAVWDESMDPKKE